MATEQEEIELKGKGVERKKIASIEKKAAQVSDLCANRMEASKKESEARAELLALLDEHGLENYRLADNRLVYVDDKRKAKIKSDEDDDN